MKQATVIVESHTHEGAVVRIVDKALGGLSPSIGLRFQIGSLEDDAAFLEGRVPQRLPDAGSFASFAQVDVTVGDDGRPILVAGALAEFPSNADAWIHSLDWSDVEAVVAQAAAKDQPDEGILYVDAGGTAFVIESRGAFFSSTDLETAKTAQACGLDGLTLPTDAGFYFFAGEPWSAVDRQFDGTEPSWGLEVLRVEPLTIAHMPSFGRTTFDGLQRLAATALCHADATRIGPVPSI